MDSSTSRVAIGDAIALVANRQNVVLDDAFAAIRERIAAGALKAEGIGDRAEKIVILPHWVRWLARFGDPSSIYPEAGTLWFDTRQATEEWRARRRDLQRRDAELTAWPLPPSRLRDITVSAAQIDELWPAPIATSHPADDPSFAVSAANAPEAGRPGPKGKQKIAKLAWQIALEILADNARRPPPGYGRCISLARGVNAELTKQGHQYQADSIRKMIGPSLREWEGRHPD
jgi:hypothetical protein